MTGQQDRYRDIKVDVLDDAGVRTAIDNALARRAWFVVSSLTSEAATAGVEFA